MNEVKSRANKKRIKILEMAISLFLKFGLKKTTMDDIAEKANVSKVTIYKYFTDKETLYREVSSYLFERYLKEFEGYYNYEGEPAKKLIKCVTVLLDFIFKGHMQLCGDISKINEDVLNLQHVFNTKIKKMIFGIIEAGKAKNIIKNNLTNESVFHYIDMSLYYFEYNGEYRKKIYYDNTFRKEFMNLFWNSIFIDYADYSELI